MTEDEFDDFGLPIFKPVILPVDDGASSSSEDEFEDAGETTKETDAKKVDLKEPELKKEEKKEESKPKEGEAAVIQHDEPEKKGMEKPTAEKTLQPTPTTPNPPSPSIPTPTSALKARDPSPAKSDNSSQDGNVKSAATRPKYDYMSMYKAAAAEKKLEEPKKIEEKQDPKPAANGASLEKSTPENTRSAKPADIKITDSTTDEKPKNTANESKTVHEPPMSPTARPSVDRASMDVKSAAEAEQASNPHIYALSQEKVAAISEWSHQQIVPQKTKNEPLALDDEWQEMPSYAPYDIYDDDGKLIAKQHDDDDEEDDDAIVGAAGKGYTRVQVDEDAQSATSMDENTQYLFREKDNDDFDEAIRNPLEQLEATKELLTEGQRVAYVGICKLGMVEMIKDLQKLECKKIRVAKALQIGVEHMKMWSQIIMVRLYKHMDITPAEQLMIEQLSEHGVLPGDLTPALMINARVKNPMAEEKTDEKTDEKADENGDEKEVKDKGEKTDGSSPSSPKASRKSSVMSRKEYEYDTKGYDGKEYDTYTMSTRSSTSSPPPYEEHMHDELPGVRTPNQLPGSKTIDLDIRWTILCDLFLVLIADSVYDARSRVLLERVGKYLQVESLDICKFEKRVTDALEMQEATKQEWNDADILEDRAKRARRKRYALMGLATVGGGLVIGLSAGLLAPVIGAGLAAGFTTIGVAGTSGFLAGTGGAAIITTTATVSGVTIAARAAENRSKSVKTFEFRPLHNNKRLNLIITISGWMNGKEDDVRLPFSTVDPIMGDIFSVYWEPEVLQSMGQTIRILATEALTQTLQQVLGSTILIALMSALQLPVILTKLSYLIDNPWSVSLDRAWSAGLILADTLIHRNLGVRPITLVGFSLGARVIFSCLLELAKRNAHGLVQNVFLFGTPVVVKQEEYTSAAGVVRGRFVNAYATNDWILGYLFRATSGGIGRVAGLRDIQDVPGLENYEVTEMVEGHMAYRAAIPKLLRKMGWEVESDTFTEIEEADPERHRERQIELMNDIEEARKAIEENEKKGKFGWFSRNKQKQAKKSAWETYDEKNTHADDKQAELKDVLFDVEAISRELENIKAKQEGKPDRNATASSPRASMSSDSTGYHNNGNGGYNSVGADSRYNSLNVAKKSNRTSLSFWSNKSHDSGLGKNSMKDVSPTATTPTATSYQKGLSPPKRYSSLNFQGKQQQSLQPEDRTGKYSVSPRRSFSSNAYAEYEPDDDYFGGAGSNRGDGDVQMTFESSWDDSPRKTRSPSPPIQMTFDSHYDDHDSYGDSGGNGGYGAIKHGSSSARATSPALSFEPPSPRRSFDVVAGKSGHDNGTLRPELTSSNSMPAKVGAGGGSNAGAPKHNNPWDDDDDEFAPKEMVMSFE